MTTVLCCPQLHAPSSPADPAERTKHRALTDEVIRQQRLIDNLSSEKAGLAHELKRLRRVGSLSVCLSSFFGPLVL